ncbi:ATP-dependent endonuclease [Aeribacillus pallidus]|uniref:ATP-dependent nuclease n=1 Tax=Aeribacillus pallidus TaxID=33936 RepID=UPI0010238EA8|nr:AAA family ATPase [Aeribacillus pallidus]RZI52306.1 ATP-dependent endonuclease [Aeribacillus pallidus]
MYISKLIVKNFRCFKDTFTIEFNPGMNVIIGANNSGKTTIIKALELIFKRGFNKSLTIDDFNKSIEDFSMPPEIEIAVILKTEKNDTEEDKALIASWITKFDENWEATLTFKYFLPESNLKEYQECIESVQLNEEKWNMLEKFLPKYVARIFGGDPNNNLRADSDLLEKIHCEVLDALRDVENKMSTGRSSLLKQVLLHFKDKNTYTTNPSMTTEDKENEKGTALEEGFTEYSKLLVRNLVNRIDVTEILKLANKTGASVGGQPGLRGKLSESDVLSILSLILKTNTGLEIPVTNNGLGYNNLIYISLILAKFKVITSESQGENAKTFPILLIEEPEAHLHPALQYNFLKYLKNEVDRKENSKQIFVTTHSTQITSAVGLDSIICIEEDEEGKLTAKYPAKVFSDNLEDIKSKNYIERFLDATKSAMLFSKSVLLVEGMAELILFPIFAENEKYDFEYNHVSVVKVDSVSFKHFIKLFGAGIKEENKKYALSKRVACVIDKDPMKKSKKPNSRWEKCWPYEINNDLENWDYREKSGTLEKLIKMKKGPNVEIFYNKHTYGKTLEYDLPWENYENNFFKKEEIKLSEDVMGLVSKIEDTIQRERAEVATKFLKYADGQKGEVAFELAYLLKNTDQKNDLKLPEYIKNAIRWVCNKDIERDTDESIKNN